MESQHVGVVHGRLARLSPDCCPSLQESRQLAKTVKAALFGKGTSARELADEVLFGYLTKGNHIHPLWAQVYARLMVLAMACKQDSEYAKLVEKNQASMVVTSLDMALSRMSRTRQGARFTAGEPCDGMV
eukprot:71449-Amphidinium_carterae.1